MKYVLFIFNIKWALKKSIRTSFILQDRTLLYPVFFLVAWQFNKTHLTQEHFLWHSK